MKVSASDLHVLGLVAVELEDLRRRVGGLGAARRVGRPQLERVVRGGVVEAEAEEAGDDLGAEAARNLEARGAGAC